MMAYIFDIKYACRLLLRSPKFTALTLFVLVGGLSISLYTFSFLFTLIYKPIDLAQSESALTISAQMDRQSVSVPAYEFSKIRAQLDGFSEVGIFNTSKFRLTFGRDSISVPGAYVDQGFFEFSRTQAIHGRTFQQNDYQAGAEKTTVIGKSFWQENFVSDENVVGKTIRINNQVHTIIGVMPDGYYFPGSAQIWLPISLEYLYPLAHTEATVDVYARLEAGVNKQSAEVQLASSLNNIYQQSVQNDDAQEGVFKISVLTFPQAQFGGAGNFMFIFLNIIALMILILASINVGNLLLARAIARQKETAIRAAIGATYRRLVLQIMWEGILITSVGCLLAIMLTGTALHYTNVLISTGLPTDIPFWWVWGLDLPTILMAVVFSLLTLFVCSFIPARAAAKQDINSTLRDGTRGAQGLKAGKMSRNLVTIQVFLISILLLIGAITAFVAQFFLNKDIGVNYQSVLVSEMTLPKSRYALAEHQSRFFHQLYMNMQSQENVEAASIVSRLGKQPFAIGGIEYQDDKPDIDTYSTIGGSDYYGIKLVGGRFFDNRDDTDGQRVALISQSMANRYWPGESALGKTIRWEQSSGNESLVIIGVVTDKANMSSFFASLDSEDEVYVSGLQFAYPKSRAMLKYTTHYMDGEKAFYDALFLIDSNLEPDNITAMEKSFDSVKSMLQTISNITFSAGLFAMILALAGIYGLTANNILQRRNEIGVRRAVGAKDSQIIRLFILQGVRQLVSGIGISLVLFGLLSYLLNDLLQGAIPLYLYLLLTGTVVTVISVSVLTAVFIPTKRVVAEEPSSVLRYE
ncbi:ABC transporter permease [Pseudoalteromonas luteoviolacea]|uniref:ABC transporter permease n=1 Tax=Pseudoalteromonas luteoviolacea TaxID=43657 RepID=UPI001B39F007|nr:ABC transporter permease [Pseudoalteromonas luteoviolacea]MBQ4879964.1 ABC transporter permease [Pseudoalteromonas luteoviolacea]MBQ4908981.1 ABC transporter permease [Pseudoalteromonas luteoviolacea]